MPARALNGHDFHFTIGENIGMPGCCIPTGDIRWRQTRQPIVLTGDARCALAVDGPVHDDRQLARQLRTGSVRLDDLRFEGPRVQEVHRAARTQRGRVRDRARHSSRRRTGPRCAARSRLARRGPAMRLCPDPRSFDDYISGLGCRMVGRAGRLRRHQQRLVQRSNGPVSRRGKAGARAGHRLHVEPSRSATA